MMTVQREARTLLADLLQQFSHTNISIRARNGVSFQRGVYECVFCRL